MTDAELEKFELACEGAEVNGSWRARVFEKVPALVDEVRRLRAERAQFVPDFGHAVGTATIFVQWKGTTVCGDFHCRCGHVAHVCGADFMYNIDCPACGVRFEVPHTLPLKEQPDRSSIATVEASEDGRIHEFTSGARIAAAERLAEAVLACDYAEPGCIRFQIVADAIAAYRNLKECP